MLGSYRQDALEAIDFAKIALPVSTLELKYHGKKINRYNYYYLIILKGKIRRKSACRYSCLKRKYTKYIMKPLFL